MFFHRVKVIADFAFLRKGLYSLPNTKNRPSEDFLRSEKEKIRYGKCIGCSDIGHHCGAGNLLNLPIGELRAWLRLWRLCFDLSIEQCAAAWDTPYGTAVRVLSDSESDFKYSTMHHIIKRVVRYGLPADLEFSDSPCPATSSEIRQQKEEDAQKLAEAEAECQLLQSKLTDAKGKHIEQMNEYRQDQQRRVDYLKSDVKLWRRFAFILGGILIIVFFALLSYVIWDLTHRDAGFFQW